MNFSSKLIEEAVDQMASLPGVGKRTAARLVLHLLKRSEDEVERFSRSFIDLKKDIKECRDCHNLGDSEICDICENPRRDRHVICVVEDIRDLLAIESTGQYNGVYHVLGGIISPMDGIGPSDLNVTTLTERCSSEKCREVIFALNTNLEGETTSFYLFKKLKSLNVNVTSIARGVAIGDELQYADEVTLGRSIQHRLPYENSIDKK